MAIQQTQRGALRCLEWQAGEGPARFVVFVAHGFGANADDLVPIGEMVAGALRGGPSTRWVFPDAPLAPADMAGWGGRAWWPLRLAELVETLQRGAIEDLTNAVPPGMDEARQMLDGAVAAVHDELSLGWDETVLCGFSQGAMISTDLTFRTPDRPRGLAALSGSLLARDAWASHTDGRCCPAFVSHGRQDPTLPFACGEALAAFLNEHGFQTGFHPFDGGHGVPPDIIGELARWMGGVLNSGNGG